MSDEETTMSDDEVTVTGARDGAWRSHGEGTTIEIPRTITIHIVRTLLDEADRAELDEEIQHVPAYQLEATLVCWLLRRIAPVDWHDESDVGSAD